MKQDGGQIRIGWAQAPGWIAEAVRARSEAGSVVVIGITGPVGAGKSTLARRVSGVVISTDSYLPDYELVPEHERDLPERADHALLIEHLEALRRGERVMVPEWSFITHRREGARPVEAASVIVVEGIHALHGRLAEAMDLRIYVDGMPEVRWARWDVLERSGVRGWGPEKAKRFFDEVAEPTFRRLAPVYMAAAHAIVRNDEGVPEEAELRRGL